MLEKIRYLTEAFFVKVFFHIFHVMPFQTASGIGSFLGKKIGPLLSVNKTAHRNIQRAFPNFTEEDITKTIEGMWDNLGRTVAEFPHMQTIKGAQLDNLVIFEGLENIDKAKETNCPIIFFSGHFSNWEMVPKTMYEKGCPSTIVYRKSNNPYVDKMILTVRNNYQKGAIPKGPIGAKQLLKAILAKEPVGILVDQKQNDGIAVPFFGHEAMTASAVAKLALRYDCVLIPIRTFRIDKCSFKTIVSPPLELQKTEDGDKDILTLMTTINSLFENWIREYPSQWFWVHNRWSDKRN